MKNAHYLSMSVMGYDRRRRRSGLGRKVAIAGLFFGAVAAGAGALFTARPEIAYAAMAVIDSTNLAKNAETAAQSAKIYQVTSETKQLINSIQMITGMGQSFGGNSPFRFGSATSSTIGAISVAKTAMPNMQRIFNGRNGNISDPSSAALAFKTNLSSREGLTPQERYQRSRELRGSVDEAQERAGGIALYMFNDLSTNSERRVRELSQSAEQAAASADSGGSLRAQISVLTAVQLANFEEAMQNRLLQSAIALLAASQSAMEAPLDNIASPGLPVSTAPKDGGSLFGKQ